MGRDRRRNAEAARYAIPIDTRCGASGCGVCGVCGTAWQSVTIIVVMAAVRDVERDGGAGRRAAIADRVGKALKIAQPLLFLLRMSIVGAYQMQSLGQIS